MKSSFFFLRIFALFAWAVELYVDCTVSRAMTREEIDMTVHHPITQSSNYLIIQELTPLCLKPLGNKLGAI